MSSPAPSRIAVVTGAGSGIGRAAARALLSGGFSVMLAGRRREPLEQAIAGFGALGARALAVPADVGDPDSVAALFAATLAAFGAAAHVFPGQPLHLEYTTTSPRLHRALGVATTPAP